MGRDSTTHRDFVMKVLATPFLVLALCAASSAAAGAGQAHVHGRAQIDVAIEARRITVHLDTPMFNLLGFEHAPRTPAQRAQADAAMIALKDAARLWRIDADAGCTLQAIELSAPALGLGGPHEAHGHDAHEAHADIEAEYGFDCIDAGRAAVIEVGLFDAFARLQNAEVQVAGPHGQFKRRLERGQARVVLRP